MGRKTWESLRRPAARTAEHRRHARPGLRAAGAEVATSLDEALALVRLPPPAFCIGGGELYRGALPRADTLYLTEIDRDFAGDVTFPPSIAPSGARRAARRARATAPMHSPTAFVTRERRAALSAGTSIEGVTMSEDGFHVHGPHDHAVEHEAQHGDASPAASR